MDPESIQLEVKNEDTHEEEEDEEEEIVCCTSEEVVFSPPVVDKVTDNGLERPYFGKTWFGDTDEVKDLQKIALAVSKGEFIDGDNVQEVTAEEVHDENDVQNGGKDNLKIETPLVESQDAKTEIVDKKIWPPKFTIMDFISAIVSCIFFLFDIASDWRLVVIYYLQNELTLFYLTLAFIVVPAVILGIISIIWSFMEHAHNKKLKSRQHSGNTKSDQLVEDSNPHLIIRVVCSLLQLGRCFRILEYMIYIIKSWREKDPIKEEQLRKKALQQKLDSAIFGLVDGFLESALQFLLQLYLSIYKQITMDFLRVATLCLSWISTAMLQTSFYRNNRKVRRKKINVGYIGAFFYFLWRLFELGPRFIILVLFAFTFKFWCTIPIAVHFVFMIIFYKVQNPELRGICCPGKKSFDIFFLLLMSYIGIFTYVNLKDGKTRKKLIIYYVIYYIENLVMGVLVMIYFSTDIESIAPWRNFVYYMLIPGFILHIVCMGIYYRFFHPTKYTSTRVGGKSGCKKRIKNCTIYGINFV